MDACVTFGVCREAGDAFRQDGQSFRCPRRRINGGLFRMPQGLFLLGCPTHYGSFRTMRN